LSALFLRAPNAPFSSLFPSFVTTWLAWLYARTAAACQSDYLTVIGETEATGMKSFATKVYIVTWTIMFVARACKGIFHYLSVGGKKSTQKQR